MKKLLFLFLLISFYTFSQTNNQKFIEGIVYNDNSYSIQGVHVLNITSNEATITDSDGNFKIFVNLNDELIFSAIQFKRNKIIRVIYYGLKVCINFWKCHWRYR